MWMAFGRKICHGEFCFQDVYCRIILRGAVATSIISNAVNLFENKIQ